MEDRVSALIMNEPNAGEIEGALGLLFGQNMQPTHVYVGTDLGVVFVSKGHRPLLLDDDLKPVAEVHLELVDGKFLAMLVSEIR